MSRVFVVTIEASPKSGSSQEHTGAFINVFICAEDESVAVSRAMAEVDQAGWDGTQLEVVCEVTRDSYIDDDAGLKYFEQVLLDGVVVVIHAYSEASSNNSIH